MSGTSRVPLRSGPFLAELACKAGAELRTSTVVTDVLRRTDRVAGVVTDKGEKIEADVVIGADGAHSTVAIKSGIRKRFKKNEITLVPQVDFRCNESRLDDVIGTANLVWFGPYCGAYQVNFRDGFHLGLGQWLDIWDTRPQDMVKRILADSGISGHVQVGGRGNEGIPDSPASLDAPPTQDLCRWGDVGGRRRGISLSSRRRRDLARLHDRQDRRSGCREERSPRANLRRRPLTEYEQRWKEPPLGREYEYGQEFVNFWRNSAFNPELMKKIVLFIGELQYLNFPGPVFDWSDDHMTIFNEHLGHLLDVMPDLSGFAKENLVPLGRGISVENRERIADMLAGVHPDEAARVCSALAHSGSSRKSPRRTLGGFPSFPPPPKNCGGRLRRESLGSGAFWIRSSIRNTGGYRDAKQRNPYERSHPMESQGFRLSGRRSGSG